MHDFTVFITSYNYGHYIGSAIDSVVKQSHSEWNLYILDNGSTDSTFEVITPYLSDPRIQLIKRPTNVGHTMNIALGYIELEGKYISTLQADDWLEPTFIEKALAAFSKYPSIPLVAFGWMAYIEPNDTYIYPNTIPYPRSFEGITALSPHLTIGNFIPQHMIAFKKLEIAAIFQEMIKTPLRQLGEQFIIKRLEDRNGPSYFSAEVAGYWRRHDAQLTNVNALNHISNIENIVEPLIYNQTHDGYNSHTRFLSLAFFISTAAQIPYRSATEWLLSENGRHLAEQYGIDINGNATLYHSLACALMMAHNTIGSSELITTDEIHAWVKELFEKFGIEPRQALSIANNAYGGHLFQTDAENLILGQFGQSPQRQRATSKYFSPDLQYQKWIKQRALLPEDGKTIANSLNFLDTQPLCFHLFLRLEAGNEDLLANTLDSISQQCYPAWHLDIITTLPSPDGLEEIPSIGWHTLRKEDEMKEVIDFLANARKFEFLLELPSGARLDPLCLWRLAIQSKDSPNASAFFFDDDCYNDSDQRSTPRFKPGVNPTALQSADLAGPICIRRDAWFAIEGATQQNGSPWFSQLLRIAEELGWDSIKHIPDVLISYPDTFPSHTESCLRGLLENLTKKEIESEIIPVTGQSWCIRYPLNTTPSISIAILSQGQLDLLSRCFDSIIRKTRYPCFEIVIALTDAQDDSDLDAWLHDIQQKTSPPVRTIRTHSTGNHATRCNAAINASLNDLVLLIREEVVIIQDKWLEELVRTSLQPGIAGVSPRLITPGDAFIQNAGGVLGLNGIVGSPHQGKTKLGEPGYLDCIQVARDVSTLPAACMMIQKAAYLAAEGMDEICFGDYLAEADLCLKLGGNKQRLIYQPLATVVYGGSATLTILGDAEQAAKNTLAESLALRTFFERWKTDAAVDPYWNPNLSLAQSKPTPETDYRPQWQYLPTPAPRILARPLTNGQGVFRITSPLRALRKAGLASECTWEQEGPREPSTAELLRLAPNTIIVQHYLHDRYLAALQSWRESPNCPFVVYSLDDLLTNMADSNPFRNNVPANSRARLKYALERSDRLVVSTAFLADTYRPFISDIKVVPNRLEQEIWLPLQSLKRTGKKPRIGWAGGSTHQGDLLLLKEIIAQTKDEGDWVFFGMCPDEIRPLVAEYHALAPFSEYPAKLAGLNLDIAVAPLAQIPFNQGKSNLRLLEYGVLGIPVICTNIDPYRDSPACCVENTASAWIEALRTRIHDADAREQEGATLRKWVHQGYLLENHLTEWLSAHLPN